MKPRNETEKVLSVPAAFGDSYDDQTVSIITSDGKVLVGTLKGIDNGTNVILDDCHERIFSIESGVVEQRLGLIVLRGENVAVVGQVDRDTDQQFDLSKCKAKALKPVMH